MRYLLDTDMCIHLMRARLPKVAKKLAALAWGDAGISVITACELEYGTERSVHPERSKAFLREFLHDLEIESFGSAAVEHYARLRRFLYAQGKPIGAMDMLIAAHALQLGACLVTNNTREFSRVPGLKTENWIA